MATQAELTVDGGAERHSVLGTLGGWLGSRDLRAFLIALGLALVVFAVSDRANPSAPAAYLAPLVCGLTVAALISVLVPSLASRAIRLP